MANPCPVRLLPRLYALSSSLTRRDPRLISQIADKRRERDRVHADIERHTRLRDAAHFEAFAADLRKTALTKLSALETDARACDAEIAALEELLLHERFWPVLGREPEALEGRWTRITDEIKDLMLRVEEYSAQVQEVLPSAKARSKRRAHAPRVLEEGEHEDVDMDMSAGEDGEVDADDPEVQKCIDEMQSWIHNLTGSVVELENQLEQQSQDALLEVQAQIDDHVHMILNGEVPLPADALGPKTKKEIIDLKDEFEKMREELQKLKLEDEKMICAKDQEIAALKEENDALRKFTANVRLRIFRHTRC
jgi:hypothetical protein